MLILTIPPIMIIAKNREFKATGIVRRMTFRVCSFFFQNIKKMSKKQVLTLDNTQSLAFTETGIVILDENWFPAPTQHYDSIAGRKFYAKVDALNFVKNGKSLQFDPEIKFKILDFLKNGPRSEFFTGFYYFRTRDNNRLVRCNEKYTCNQFAFHCRPDLLNDSKFTKHADCNRISINNDYDKKKEIAPGSLINFLSARDGNSVHLGIHLDAHTCISKIGSSYVTILRYDFLAKLYGETIIYKVVGISLK